jgi:hypothetical protein
MIDAPPLGEQLREYLRALIREAVEPLVALRLFTPLAEQQPLGLEPPQERIESPFVNVQSVFGE